MNRNKFKLCSISCIIYLPWYHYLAFFNLNWYFSMFSYIFSEKVVVECFARGRGIVILGKDSFEISHLLRNIIQEYFFFRCDSISRFWVWKLVSDHLTILWCYSIFSTFNIVSVPVHTEQFCFAKFAKAKKFCICVF